MLGIYCSFRSPLRLDESCVLLTSIPLFSFQRPGVSSGWPLARQPRVLMLPQRNIVVNPVYSFKFVSGQHRSFQERNFILTLYAQLVNNPSPVIKGTFSVPKLQFPVPQAFCATGMSF